MQTTLFETDDSNTLKKQATIVQSSVIWTNALENTVLSRDITKMEGISASIKLTPDVMYAANDAVPVYPSLEDFGSLDISELNSAARFIVNGFCTAVSAGTSADNFISAGRLYTLVLFLSDIKRIWPAYSIDMPEAQPFFTAWVLGKPFISEDVFFVPVRLLTKKGLLDIQLSLNQSSDWKIDRIHIIKYSEMGNG